MNISIIHGARLGFFLFTSLVHQGAPQPLYPSLDRRWERSLCCWKIPLAISSTEWGGLGCLYGIILWEVLALNGVEHAIL